MSPNKYTGPWAPGMLVRSDRNSGTTYVIVTQPDENGWCSAYDTKVGEVVEGLLDMAEPVWDSVTVGALAGVVRKMYPEWFAISCQYRGSREAWNVVARRQAYRDRNEHQVLGEGATEHDAWLAAYHAHPSAASPASVPVRGDAADLDAAGVSAKDIEVLRG